MVIWRDVVLFSAFGSQEMSIQLDQMSREEFAKMPLHKKIKTLYLEGTFVVAIRYYRHKINLYLLENEYVEVFYNHKEDRIDKIDFYPATTAG